MINFTILKVCTNTKQKKCSQWATALFGSTRRFIGIIHPDAITLLISGGLQGTFLACKGYWHKVQYCATVSKYENNIRIKNKLVQFAMNVLFIGKITPLKKGLTEY